MRFRIDCSLKGRPPSRVFAGFTLLELLLVIAVLGLLTVVAIPVISGIDRRRDITSSAYGLHDLLEFARSEAMARNTYTWVGFANVPSTHPGNGTGAPQVVAAVFCSQDGTPTVGQSLIGALVKPLKFKNVKIVASSSLEQGVRDQLDAGTALSLAAQSGSKSLPSAGGITFSHSITYTPQGLAMVKPEPSAQDGFDEAVDIGLVQMAGDTELPSPNDVCLRVSGASGTARIYRLQ